MEKKTTNEFTITQDSIFTEVDAQNITSFIKKYCHDFQIDFTKDISLSISTKYDEKIQRSIMKITLKDKEVDEAFDPAQTQFDFAERELSKV